MSGVVESTVVKEDICAVDVAAEAACHVPLDTLSSEFDKAIARLALERQTLQNALRTIESRTTRPNPSTPLGTEPFS